METFAPVFRVKTDKELCKILKSSRRITGSEGKLKCYVCIMGSTHTEDGMVMQRTGDNVVVISLAD